MARGGAISSMPCLDMRCIGQEHSRMENDGWINLLGLCAGFLTTVSFLPQLLKAWKSRSMHDISIGPRQAPSGARLAARDRSDFSVLMRSLSQTLMID